jgi:hypothetical protein
MENHKRSHPGKIEILENLKGTFFRGTFHTLQDGYN